MKNQLVTLAAIKSFYESGCDFIDVFSNLVLQEIPTKPIIIINIQQKVIDEWNINIPLDVIRTIVKRLKRKSLIDYKNREESIWTTSDGETEKIKIKSTIDSTKRESLALIKKLKIFIEKKSRKKINSSNVSRALDAFIHKNYYSVASILAKEQQPTYPQLQIEKMIMDFFIKTEESDPENFERLKAIVYGKIISSVLVSQRKNFVKEAKFEPLDIYLDTNILFSVMGLHEESFNKPARELIKILKKLGFNLFIFGFTRDEVVAKLKDFIREYDNYSEQIPVDSIYYQLKRLGFSKQDIILKIQKIEEELKALGIEIDYQWDIDKLLDEREEKLQKLEEKKLKSGYSIKHDIAAIEAIRQIRGKRVYLIEKSKAIFLTADSRLSIFSFKNYDHKLNSSLPEVIFRTELTSILWLKNPGINPSMPIHDLIAGYAKNFLLKVSLWEKFIAEIKRQKKQGKINDEDISILISSNETEKILFDIQSGAQKENYIPLLIDEQIRKRKKEKKLKEKEIEHLKKKEQGIRQELNSLRKQIEKYENIKKSIRSHCEKKWNFILNFLICLIAIVISRLLILFILKVGLGLFESLTSLTVFLVILWSTISLISEKDFKFLSFMVSFKKKLKQKLIKNSIDKNYKKFGL
ncbi:MAG TPA: hypothetical protein VMY36_01735 [Patescibacteria group bacterium]|nr:hypothetical protein [Patescibacteria group bacterium]